MVFLEVVAVIAAFGAVIIIGVKGVSGQWPWDLWGN